MAEKDTFLKEVISHLESMDKRCDDSVTAMKVTFARLRSVRAYYQVKLYTQKTEIRRTIKRKQRQENTRD
jgi:hypothetical protein